MSEFVHCLDLCELFYHEAVRPVMERSFPHLPYAAAVLGRGSEIRGLDDEISADHSWGPFVGLFLREEDLAQSGDTVLKTLGQALAPTFHGYRVGVKPDGPVVWDYHCTEVVSLRFLSDYLNFDLNDEIEPIDWLTFPQHRLLDVTSGEVYHDEIGLQGFRDRFAYYPNDVWLYMLTAEWSRIAQEEHLMGRAGSAGDELGAAVIASRLAQGIMRLCFLMEKQYAPYPKWFGTAFRKLKCGEELAPLLRDIQLAETWQDREKHFAAAWERVGAIHNSLGITEHIPVTISHFFTRPYTVCNSTAFGEAIRAQIKDPELSRLASNGLFGGVDQMSDSTALLDNARWRPVLRKLYEMGST